MQRKKHKLEKIRKEWRQEDNKRKQKLKKTRQEFILDYAFTPKFYDLESTGELNFAVDFPLPDLAPETLLADFFKSDNGKQFRAAGSRMIKQLTSWANKHAIDSEPLRLFHERYFNYSGENIEINNSYMQLYVTGIPALSHIVNMLDNPQIFNTVKQEVIEELFLGLDVCGPGTYTNIINAHLTLLAQLNLPMRLLRARRQVAEHAVLNLMKSNERIPPGNEIHYVNAIINHYARQLCITPIEDANIVICCNKKILDSLLVEFEEIAKSSINLYSILTVLIEELDYPSLANKMNQPDNREVMSQFSQQLNYYGTERGVVFSHNDDLVEFEDNGLTFTTSWRAPYVLYLSLLRRLQSSGFVESDYEVVKFDNKKIFYLPGKSLIFAYVKVDNDPAKKMYQPFLTFYAQAFVHRKFLQENPRLLKFIAACLNPMSHKVHFCAALCSFYSSLPREEKLSAAAGLTQVILYLIPHGFLLDYMPLSELTTVCLGILPMNELLSYTNNAEDFKSLLNAMSCNAERFIRYLYYKKIQKIGDLDLVCYAAGWGFVKTAQWLLRKQQRDDSTYEINSVALRIAINNDNLQMVLAILNNRHVNIDTITHMHCYSALHVAVIRGKAEIVGKLLAHGAKPNTFTNHGSSPLSSALKRKYYDIAAELIQYGAEFSVDLLFDVVRRDIRSTAAAIIIRLPVEEVNIKNEHGETALYLAAFYQHIEIAEMLLARGADVNAKDNLGRTPLMVAVQQHDLGMILLLLFYRADPTIKGVHSCTHEYKSSEDYARELNFPEITSAFAIQNLELPFLQNGSGEKRVNAFHRLMLDAIYENESFESLYGIFTALNHLEANRSISINFTRKGSEALTALYQALDQMYEDYRNSGKIEKSNLLDLCNQADSLARIFSQGTKRILTRNIHYLHAEANRRIDTQLAKNFAATVSALKECLQMYPSGVNVIKVKEEVSSEMERPCKRR